MSKFIDSQAQRLCEEVDKYGQKLGFLEKPRKIDGETIPGESVPWEAYQDERGCWTTFMQSGRSVTVLIAEKNSDAWTFDHRIFPCGVHLDRLVKQTAKAVVHALFEPSEA